MNKVIIRFLICLVMIVAVSCKKDQSAIFSAQSAILKTSKTDSIKHGETVTFTFSPADSGKIITWSVTPGVNTQISGSGGMVYFLLYPAATNLPLLQMT